MKFDSSFTASLRGAGVVLYHREGETIALSLKLECPYLNNTIEYEATP